MVSVFGFLSLMTRCGSKIVLIFLKPKSRFTFVVSDLLLLIGVENKTWSVSRFHDQGGH